LLALTLSVSPDVKLNGDVTAHLIPALNFGVNVLNGKAEADIFINLDTSATLAVNVDAKGTFSETIQTKRTVDIAERDFAGSVNGCVGMTTGVAANVGATGKFFSLFDANTALPLFNKQFQLFKVAPSTLIVLDCAHLLFAEMLRYIDRHALAT
jgi:hypothetical protein